MKPYLADLIRAAPTPAHGRNVTREYLQARILGALQRAGAMIPLAFHGGTARYSENLAFAPGRAHHRRQPGRIHFVHLAPRMGATEVQDLAVLRLKESEGKCVRTPFPPGDGPPAQLHPAGRTHLH